MTKWIEYVKRLRVLFIVTIQLAFGKRLVKKFHFEDPIKILITNFDTQRKII